MAASMAQRNNGEAWLIKGIETEAIMA